MPEFTPRFTPDSVQPVNGSRKESTKRQEVTLSAFMEELEIAGGGY